MSDPEKNVFTHGFPVRSLKTRLAKPATDRTSSIPSSPVPPPGNGSKWLSGKTTTPASENAARRNDYGPAREWRFRATRPRLGNLPIWRRSPAIFGAGVRSYGRHKGCQRGNLVAGAQAHGSVKDQPNIMRHVGDPFASNEPAMVRDGRRSKPANPPKTLRRSSLA